MLNAKLDNNLQRVAIPTYNFMIPHICLLGVMSIKLVLGNNKEAR